ncbi:MAG: PolC-type DNA polymerase III, partial [Ureaplasma sp.]|nr:PolC-type DNA polymerase III [Ureaplasma sp.]
KKIERENQYIFENHHESIISKEQFEIAIKRIINFTKKQNKLIVATSNAYYLKEEDKQFHNLYVNLPILNKRNHRFKNYGTGPKMHYRTTEQMLNEFNFLNDHNLINDIVINNPNKILESFDFSISPIKEKLYPPSIPGVNEKIRNEVYLNAHKMYGEKLPEIVESRIKKELDSIINHGYAVVYWISHLLVKESIKDGYVVGSRGSVGSSIVATFLNITDVNPLPPHYLCTKCQFSDFNINSSIEDGYDLPIIKCPKCGIDMQGDGHNILFEVFLGFYGDKVPDIDLNFSGDYQNKAHEFIKSMFGKEYTYRAGTISTIAEKTSYANARSYFELINKEKKYSEIERYASKCVDVKRTTGQHPGGIIVVPSDMSIFDFTPYNFPADDFEQNWYTTHFAFEHIHDNLLKFDILGHDNPTILKILKDLTNIDEKDIPHYDPKTISLFSSNKELKVKSSDILGETTGAYSIPEYGTKFVREMLRDTKPATFADLIRISGLSHGTDVWIGNAKSLIDDGLKLNEIIACRDDIMSYLIKHEIEPKIAFNIMEDVRKGKQIKDEYIDLLLKNNVPKWYIDSCNKIKYMFPKAHATAYVMHAWKFAWYKLNYPLEYYSAYFTIRTDVFNLELLCGTIDQIRDEYNYINDLIRKKETVTTKQKDLLSIYEVAIEMYARGYKFKMIDIKKSDAKNFVIDYESNALICPFRTIDGLGDSIANSIVEARNIKEFANKDDFIERTKVSKQHIKKMDELEILDSLKDSSQINIFDIKF